MAPTLVPVKAGDRVKTDRRDATKSPQNKELLAGVVLRPPDVIFDQEATIDLGGVTARLLWFGGAHTKGDELTFVEPDRTLISGDVVQNKTSRRHTCGLACRAGEGSSPQRHTGLPDHGAPGDGSLVAAELNLISEIRTRGLGLKRQGISPDDAGKRVSADLKTQHPDWPNTNAAGFVQRVYAELQ